MATKSQKAHALAAYFAAQYELATGRKYHGNVFRDKWGYQDMLDDLGETTSKKVIDWYFKTSRDEFTPQDLHRNYDRLYEAMDDHARDMEMRQAALDKTREAVERFRNRGNNGFN